MTNKARGETVIDVDGIGEITLCLTMGGMAELEDAFDVENIQEAVAKVGENPSSKNMATILHALMLGTEHADKSVEEIRRWPVTPNAIRKAMAAMNASNEEGEGNASAEGNRAQRKAAESKKKKAPK